MATKTEEATSVSATPGGAEADKPAKAPGVMMPILMVVVLMPAIAYGLTEFVLIPKLRAALPAASAEAGAAGAAGGAKKAGGAAGGHGAPAKKAEGGGHGAAKKAEGGGHGEKKGEGGGEGAEASFEFKDIIVNLSGALGTRYLKTSFTVSGSDGQLPDLVKENRQKLLDVAISVLSARTVNDLESPAAKNAVRAELIAKFNHSIGAEIVEELYFSEFVIQ